MYQRKLVQTAEDCTALAEKISKAPAMGFDTEFHGPLLSDGKFVNIYRSTLTGFSVSFWYDHTSYYVPVAHQTGNAPYIFAYRVLEALQETGAKVAIHNAKNERHILGWLPRNFDCTMVMAWVLQLPGMMKNRISYGLKALAPTHMGLEMSDFEAVAQGRPWNLLTPEEALDYACEDAEAAEELLHVFENHQDWSLVSGVYERVERPLIPVLQRMEARGMGVDRSQLLTLADELTVLTQELRRDWEFNFPDVSITSPVQVRKHFLDGGLWPKSGVDKTPTGLLSVNRDTMAAALAHPRTGSAGREAARIRMEFQDANKILNTYTHTLVEKLDQHTDGRIHPSFLQTGTRTGRLSCVDPNLMNIPARSELGKAVKRCFTERGRVMVSADYSQLELRIAAHMAGEGPMRAAFAPGAGDFFDTTSEKMDKPRHHCKTAVYAWFYGASGQRIGKTLGIGRKGGNDLLKELEATYPELVALKERLVTSARVNGYSRTLEGHIRRLGSQGTLDWKDRNRASNTPIQGSGAAITKMSMIAADKQGIELTCQVHDENVAAADEKVAKSVAEALREAMETATVLAVPLLAEPKVIDTWDQSK